MAEAKKDNTSGIFGQVEYSPVNWLKFVAAGRWDRSTLHKSEFSPKGAVVWSPSPDHSLRFTYNQAFQVPNYSEFYLQVGAGIVPPALYSDPRTPGRTVPILARGNPNLKVEKIEGFEIGYKGVFFDKSLFVTVDGYLNKAKDFITDLLQGVNPMYPYNPPAGLAEILRNTLPGLTLVNGLPAVVVSYTNAGKVDERGVEVSFNYYVTKEFSLNGNWTWYDFKVLEQQSGDVLLPNAPKHKFAAGFTWTRDDGIDLSMSARNVQPFTWSAGVFSGKIRAYTTVNGSIGYKLSKNYRLGVTVTNLFDNRVYQLFGGSVIGRQAIATVTATF